MSKKAITTISTFIQQIGLQLKLIRLATYRERERHRNISFAVVLYLIERVLIKMKLDFNIKWTWNKIILTFSFDVLLFFWGLIGRDTDATLSLHFSVIGRKRNGQDEYRCLCSVDHMRSMMLYSTYLNEKKYSAGQTYWC